MTSEEFLNVAAQAQDFPKGMRTIIEEYGRILLSEKPVRISPLEYMKKVMVKYRHITCGDLNNHPVQHSLEDFLEQFLKMNQ